MKEVVLTKPPYMNASEKRIADMHSLLNIFNILIGELSLIEPKPQGLVEESVQLEKELHDIVKEIKEGDMDCDRVSRVRKSTASVIEFAHAALEAESMAIGKAAIKQSISNLESVLSVLEKRLDEFEVRAKEPDVWVHLVPEAFRQQFQEVFAAIAKNSKGSYKIQFDPEKKGRDDYYVALKVASQRGDGQLVMPLRLIDVLRDLTANARKYTPPGGKLGLAVSQDESSIEAVIEDNGCGIPDDEIEKVAEFGYRASNVRQRPTHGGGFGLTKAVWLVTNWGGSLTIRSEVDVGTTVRLSVPNPAPPDAPEA